jgi:hypothetical protein
MPLSKPAEPAPQAPRFSVVCPSSHPHLRLLHRAASHGLRVGGDQGGRAGRVRRPVPCRVSTQKPFLLRKAKQSFYNTSPHGHEDAHGRSGPHQARTSTATCRSSLPPSVTSLSDFEFFTARSTGLPSAACLYQVAEKFTAHRPAPGDGLEHRDGHRLRGTDSQIR